MTVLLVRPPRRDSRDAGLPVPPLGLAYLAAVLRDAGRPVELLDAYALGWSWRRFEGELARRRPEVLGLGTMTPVADVAYQAARLARPYARRVILGGPHPTAVGEAAFEDCEALDHLALGEAEESILPYLDWLEAGEAGPPPAGIMARGQPYTERSPRRPIEGIPWPARDLLPGGAYRYLMATRPGFATMITSRGCPFRCSFCDKSVSGDRWRARGAEDVVDELAALAGAGVGFVNLYDDNFTLHRRRVVEICEEILRRGVDIEWKCEGRVDGVDPELLRLMRRAGCRVVAYGVESANPDTLSLLRKDVTPERAREAFAATREAGLRSVAYVILGAPGEGAAEVRRTVRFTKEIGADYVQFSSLVALPGTPLFAEHHERAAADVRNPVDGDRHRRTITDLPPEELARLMRQAWSSFYLRPRPIARLARDAWASGATREALRLGGAMARWSLAPEARRGEGWQPDDRIRAATRR
ncbi:MAG: B12-binding domain-containing radical SAM protein [Alphaproteobacteria bacterium]|nr:B12-binding domain-containing radical SAM protein [Alphaproteobacteria bacterium]MCB9795935.1 B12-binding domain-containing radical SAM protein [Alphaproteobacteria bacterium]